MLNGDLGYWISGKWPVAMEIKLEAELRVMLRE
jgi:hypothetical protein